MMVGNYEDKAAYCLYELSILEYKKQKACCQNERSMANPIQKQLGKNSYKHKAIQFLVEMRMILVVK